MLFLACEANLKSLSLGNLSCRKFPFDLLKDDKHDYNKLKTAFPNEKFKLVVQKVLRNKFGALPAAPPAPAPPAPAATVAHVLQFNRLCDIFEFMYVARLIMQSVRF
jgi:hypothetical protein